MTFWQENYHFIKDVYDMRHQKMAEWMENVEKAIARIMADKVYTSAEFKRERDNFHALCKDLEKAEVKQWLAKLLEILMAERNKEMKDTENGKLEILIQKHEQLIPTVLKTQVMVDLYWKCYAYGDELKPHIEFLEGIMTSSTRDIAPSCLENVEELMERQEKSLLQLDTKRDMVNGLIEKGKKILENPEKPKFLEKDVKSIREGWEDTKEKAKDRLDLLISTKQAWLGYADDNATIATDFEVADEEIKKIKKRYNLENAMDDLKKRQELYRDTNNKITSLFNSIKSNYDFMCKTLPEDKKKELEKEVAAVSEKLDVLKRFEETVANLDTFCGQLGNLAASMKSLDSWMTEASRELDNIRNAAGSMLPEDRVARTMDLQEDIRAKLEILAATTEQEKALLPQGDGVDRDAQEHKDELARVTKFIRDLETSTKKECDAFSEDVKYFAEFMTGVKEFTPWLEGAEADLGGGLKKPSTLQEVQLLHQSVHAKEEQCRNYLKVLETSFGAAQKMTTHETADKEVAVLKERYNKLKAEVDKWVGKVDVLLKEWTLLDDTVTTLNSWVGMDKTKEGENQFSLEKMESTLGELKNLYNLKEKLVEGL